LLSLRTDYRAVRRANVPAEVVDGPAALLVARLVRHRGGLLSALRSAGLSSLGLLGNVVDGLLKCSTDIVEHLLISGTVEPFHRASRQAVCDRVDSEGERSLTQRIGRGRGCHLISAPARAAGRARVAFRAMFRGKVANHPPPSKSFCQNLGESCGEKKGRRHLYCQQRDVDYHPIITIVMTSV